jgi:hypothetical protein
MTKDRAAVVATALIALLTRVLRNPTLHQEVAAMLRDEFEDIQRQLLNERNRD